MKIKNGRNRTVIIFEKFVVKIPRIFFKKSIKIFYRAVEGGYIFKKFAWKPDIKTSFSWFLLSGILDNWREFYFYFKTRPGFVIPTYFSFFGLLNIQKTGNILVLNDNAEEYMAFFGQLNVITEGAVFNATHTFANPENFSRENGKLLMVDYGDIRVQSVLTDYGDKILKEFNFSFLRS